MLGWKYQPESTRDKIENRKERKYLKIENVHKLSSLRPFLFILDFYDSGNHEVEV